MNVLMVGPDIVKVPGGMSTVLQNYMNSSLNNKVKLRYISTNIEGFVLFKILHFFIALIKYTFILLVKSADVIHIHMAERGSFYRMTILLNIGKMFGKKIILHFHGAEFDCFYNNSNNFIKRIITSNLDKSDLIIALSQQWENKIKEYTKTKVVVLYNAIRVNAENYYNVNSNNITLLGRLEERKGTFDVLDIVDNFNEKNKNVCFVLAGDGNLSKVKEVINNKKYKHNIKLLGWINENERIRVLKETAILILPSYNEGMPMAILEALSFGIPIVASNVGGIPEIIKDKENGFLIEAGDKIDLKNKLDILMNDNELRKGISKNNYLKSKDMFNLERNVDILTDIYASL